MEALTELQIAWKAPATEKILDSNVSALAFRSLWLICESSRALPNDKELQQLADDALSKSNNAAQKALQTLREKPDDQSAYIQVLYRALAENSRNEFVKAARPLLTQDRNEESSITAIAPLAKSLLSLPTTQLGEDLIAMISSDFQGNESVALIALACRRAGGDVWQAFRAKSQQFLGEQPLNSNVVLLVSRLDNPTLPIVHVTK